MGDDMTNLFARSILLTFATVVLVFSGGTAGAAEEPDASTGPGTAYGVTPGPGGSYSVEHTSGGRVHSRQPSAFAVAGARAASYSVTLITGDRVLFEVFPDGRQAARVDPAPRGEGLPAPTFETLGSSGDLYVFPSDAARYLDDKLDRELFNVTELVAQGFHDGASESLPLIVDYERTVGVLPPALDRVDTLESIDAAAARQPRGKAAAFGRAVAEQARRAAPADPGLFAGIEKIWLDQTVEATLAESVPQIGAPTVWDGGYDGTGIVVAVLDTGIDATHPDLAGAVVDAFNFTNSPSETDRHGHGTHVASIVAGSGAASGGARKGVAPGAGLLNGKVLADNGFGSTSWIIAGMEWAARDKGADIVSMSLASVSTDGSDPMSQAVDSLTSAYGTLFVAAAGNAGPRAETVAAPGAASAALTVGAVDKSDGLAGFSSRGPRVGDFAIKPDITAPGVSIVAARASGTSLGTPVDDLYTQASGTSMATPHVAGAAALLAQRRPDWDPAELKAALVTTAEPGPYSIYQQGGGRVDVARAVGQTTVLATPAPLDLGFFPWPHEGRDPVTKTVTYTNLSDIELSLALALEVADEDGQAPRRGMLALGSTSVTLAPSASQEVEISLDSLLGATGAYGGYLVARDEGGAVVLRTPVGFYKQPEVNPWRLQATLPGTVIKDISFASPTVGYIAAELGKVWKTTDGGETWTSVMNLGFPYYWYGVDTLSEQDVVISGFNNSNFQGVLRWSHDGGQTWSPDVVLTTRGWAGRVRFADARHGLVMDLLALGARNAAHHTANGGQTAADWTEVVVDPAGGWFGSQFTFLSSLQALASGITFCRSPDGGASWGCRPSIDQVFDGPTFFFDEHFGWVGGGSISPTVEGWMHRTTNGGKKWSDRTLAARWPIREIRFVTRQLGWAAGGNIYSGGGGLYFSKDGGRTWSLDLDSGAEMDACDDWRTGPRNVKVWCAGYDGSFTGKVYTLERTAPAEGDGGGDG
jgi:subtilisin family serine protease/photosystem II stability/assembly factor-like uncharacterized protein